MEKKTFRAPVELKADGDEGTFRSVFAQFNVVDHDGDVTEPGAFRDGQEVVVEGWNHDYGLPPGKGVIHANDKEAWVDGRFFLDTTPGKDHYLTLKNLEGLEEWSYTFMIENAESGEVDGERVRVLKGLDVWGVAPVTRGAGIGTRTLALKGAGDHVGVEIQMTFSRWKRELQAARNIAAKAVKEGRELTAEEQRTIEGIFEETQGLDRLFKALQTEPDDGSTSEDGEGEAGGDDQPDGKPSGVSPSVVLTEIEIISLEG